MNTDFRLLKVVGSAVFLLAGTVTATHAVPQLLIQATGATDIVVVDETDDDFFDDEAGVLGWSGTIGTFRCTAATGFTKPDQGGETSPDMHLDVAASSKGAGVLKVTFTDDGFTGSPLGMMASFGGVLGSSTASATYKTYVNNILVPLTEIAASGAGGLAISGTDWGTIFESSYSLKLVVELTTTAKTSASSLNSSLVGVPDGGTTALLLGLGFLGVAGFRRRIS